MALEKKIYFLDVDYVLEEEGATVRLFGQLEDGRSAVALVKNFRPYLYVLPEQNIPKERKEELKDRLASQEVEGREPVKVEEVSKTLLGDEVKAFQVTLTSPTNLSDYRDQVKDGEDVRKVYEYGINFYKRFIIDNQLVPMDWVSVRGNEVETDLNLDLALEAEEIKPASGQSPKLKILAFDLEVVEEKGEEKIIMASIKDTEGLEKVLTYKEVDRKNTEVLDSEKGLLQRFMEVIQEVDPQLIVTYNGDQFDFQKLRERTEELDLELKLGRDQERVVFKRRGRISSAKITGRVHLDIYDFVNHILSSTLTSEILTLDMVSREILGTGKEKMEWKKIEEAWRDRKDLEKVADYCLRDSALTLRLAQNLLPLISELSRLTGQKLFDTCRMSYSQLVESILIRRATLEDRLVLNRPKYGEIQKRRKAEAYKGAYVHKPRKGIHENIAVLDFTSLYPSIIVTYNISPETLDCGHKECKDNKPDGEHYFCRKTGGFIPSLLKELIELRKEVKKRQKNVSQDSEEYITLNNRQSALKILANAFYGYFGYSSSRWYSRVCAQAITSFGRKFIKETINQAQKEGFEVLYADTDSVFLKMEEEKRGEMKKRAMDFLQKVNHSLPGIMELDFKDLYKRGIFIEAKTGMAAKKKYALLDQNDELVMRGMETRRKDWARIAKDTQERVLMAVLKDNSLKKAVKEVRKTIKELKKENVSLEDLVIFTQLTKPISEYEQKGPHVRAAEKTLERGGTVGQGSTIAYIITRGSGSISDRAEPVEDAENYDPDYYIKHQVVPAALRTLSNLGVEKEDLLGEGKQESLEDFLEE